MNSNREKNQTAYRKAKQELSARFPPGHFVAFDNGQILGDAPTFDELTAALRSLGKDVPDVFVVQAGADYADELFILL